MEFSIPLAPWRQLEIPRVVATEWTIPDAKVGLIEIKRLRGLLEAAQAVLVGIVATESGRDTKAALARHLNMSKTEAAKATAVAEVLNRVEDAEQALADGRLTADQVHKLAAIKDNDEAAELLKQGADNRDTPEEFERRVRQHRINSEGPSLRDRQRASRGLWFFPADHGCVGFRGVLPPVEGNRLKASLDGIVDAKYRAKHPERAPQAGGHQEEPLCRRMADALVQAVVGESSAQTTAGGTHDGSSNPSDSSRHTSDNTGQTSSQNVGHYEPNQDSGSSQSKEPQRPPDPPKQHRNQNSGGRIAVIVTINAETLESEILGDGPITTLDALDLIGQAKVDLYAAIRNTKGEIINFGRNRRLASPLQQIALAVRDGGTCVQPGCNTPWNQCDADHIIDWNQGGTTNLTNLRHLCSKLHHPHRHETNQTQRTNHEQTWHQATPPPEAA